MPPRLLLIAFLAALLPLCAGVAQKPPRLSPGWYVRTQQFNNTSASERAIIERNLNAAERLIMATTGYARPVGFEAQAEWVTQASRGPGRLRTYWVAIKAFQPTWDAGSGGNSAYVIIQFNPELGSVSDGSVRSETGEWYYHERARSPAAYGTAFVYGTFGTFNSNLRVLFTAHNQDPMLPVSREEYLRARIYELDGDGKLKEAQASVTRTPYQEWLAGAAERKKERDELLAAMSSREAAEKMRASLEQTERDVTDNLKKREAVDAENIRTLKGLDPSKPLRDELAAMTPQERASPAWAGGTALMPAGAPNALRVVRANPAFFRPRASPMEPRAILMFLKEPWQSITTAQNQLHREFDWAAIRKLLDTRP